MMWLLGASLHRTASDHSQVQEDLSSKMEELTASKIAIKEHCFAVSVVQSQLNETEHRLGTRDRAVSRLELELESEREANAKAAASMKEECLRKVEELQALAGSEKEAMQGQAARQRNAVISQASREVAEMQAECDRALALGRAEAARDAAVRGAEAEERCREAERRAEEMRARMQGESERRECAEAAAQGAAAQLVDIRRALARSREEEQESRDAAGVMRTEVELMKVEVQGLGLTLRGERVEAKRKTAACETLAGALEQERVLCAGLKQQLKNAEALIERGDAEMRRLLEEVDKAKCRAAAQTAAIAALNATMVQAERRAKELECVSEAEQEMRQRAEDARSEAELKGSDISVGLEIAQEDVERGQRVAMGLEEEVRRLRGEMEAAEERARAQDDEVRGRGAESKRAREAEAEERARSEGVQAQLAEAVQLASKQAQTVVNLEETIIVTNLELEERSRKLAEAIANLAALHKSEAEARNAAEKERALRESCALQASALAQELQTVVESLKTVTECKTVAEQARSKLEQEVEKLRDAAAEDTEELEALKQEVLEGARKREESGKRTCEAEEEASRLAQELARAVTAQEVLYSSAT
eukprot:2344754-Rhodomonas_salina.4